MLSIERRQQIKVLMLAKKSMTVSELSEIFNVSSETIRRDLFALEREGFLTKSYGGAAVTERAQPFVTANTLLNLFVEEKKRIAQKAVSFLHNNDCIFLDHSTTAYYMCDEIENMPLTVVTNSLGVLTRLSNSPSITLVSTSGTLNRTNNALFGINASYALKNYHLDTVFISFRSLDMKSGFSDNTELESELHRTVMSIARKIVILADHTKLDKVSFIKVCNFDDIDVLIVDTVLNKEWKEFLKNKKIEYFECPES